MEDQAIRGIRWTLLGYGATRVGSVATTFVLARLLVPDDFGLVAFALLITGGVVIVGGLGLNAALVVRQDLEEGQLRTVLTLMIAAYVGCAGVITALSPLANDVLGDPDAGAVLRALAIPILFGGITWFYAAVMQRELLFPRQFASLAGQVVTGAVVAIPLAIADAGVWSIVAGQIAGAFVFTCLLVTLAPYRLRPGFDPATARSVLRTGSGFMLHGGVTYLEQNADYAIVGAKLGPQSLGLYSMAYRIGEIPYNFVIEPIAQATFPGFARMRHRSEDVASAFLTTLRLVALAAFPLGLLCAGVAEPFVESILGPKWTGVIDVLRILGIWASLHVIDGTIGWFLNSVGLAGRVGIAYAAMLVVSLPVLILAANEWGVEGVAWVMVANAATIVAVAAVIVHRQVGIPVARQWLAIQAIVIAAVAAAAVAAAAAAALTDIPAGVALVVSTACGTVVYFGMLRLLEPGLVRDAREQVVGRLWAGETTRS